MFILLISLFLQRTAVSQRVPKGQKKVTSVPLPLPVQT